MAARSARLALGGCAAVLALAACSAGHSAPTAAPVPSSSPTPGHVSSTTEPDAGSVSPVIAGQPGGPPKIPGALSPAQLVTAYDIGPLLARGITGKGQTIAIIDPYGSPTIKQDLAAYDKAWQLAAPPSFRVITPEGQIPPFRPTANRVHAVRETTMDVEAAHVMAPGAAILLVETPSLQEFANAMVYVISHDLASVISLSLDDSEANFPSLWPFHRAILGAGQPGSLVTLVAATGDYGATNLKTDSQHLYRTPQVGWPASDPLVVAVGGTRLGAQPPSAPVAPATSWPHSNGGRSRVFTRPPWQNAVAGVAGRWRAIPDISLAASRKSGLEMYTTARSGGAAPGYDWSINYGASLAAPLFAGVVALADQEAGRALGPINPLLYRLAAQHDPGIIDVQGPGNTYRHGGLEVRGFPAGPGYDLVTGLGTIDAAKFVPDLVRLARQEAH
jgi:subtilase family serine protease